MLVRSVLFPIAVFCSIFIGQATIAVPSQSRSKVSIDEGPLIDYLLMVIANVQDLIVDPKEVGGYHLDSFANNSVDVSGVSADFESTVISGISNFAVDELAFEVVILTGKLRLSWPLVSVVCTYSAEGLVSGSAATAAGDLSISYEDIQLNGTLAFGFNETALIIKELALELTYGKSSVELTNLVGSEEIQDELQELVSDLTNEIFDALAAKFAAIGGDEAAEVLNPILSLVGKVPPGQLLEEVYLLPNRLHAKLGLMW